MPKQSLWGFLKRNWQKTQLAYTFLLKLIELDKEKQLFIIPCWTFLIQMGGFTLSPFEASPGCVLPLQLQNFHRPKENFRWTISVKITWGSDWSVDLFMYPRGLRFAGWQQNGLLPCRCCSSVDAPADRRGGNEGKSRRRRPAAPTWKRQGSLRCESGRHAVNVVRTSSGETAEQQVTQSKRGR